MEIEVLRILSVSNFDQSSSFHLLVCSFDQKMNLVIHLLLPEIVNISIFMFRSIH